MTKSDWLALKDGDRVTYICPQKKKNGLRKGKVYDVYCDTFNGPSIIDENGDRRPGGGAEKLRETDPFFTYFRIYKRYSPDGKSHLERLIDRANDGAEAMRELWEKHRGQFEADCYDKHTKNWDNNWQSSGGIFSRFRIKKSELKKFTLMVSGQTVKIYEDFVYIGCKGFNKNSLKGALRDLLIKDRPHTHLNRIDVSDHVTATYKGIAYKDHILVWSDVEQLYDQLVK